MSARPHMRRWTDRRDGREWRILYEPGVEEDPPTVRYAREALVFEGEGGPIRAPAAYGSDLADLSDPDLQGLLDQAREAKAERHASAGWGTAPASAEGEGAGDGEEGEEGTVSET